MTLKVDKAAKNFDQVQVGDELQAEYIDAVAVRKSGAPPEASAAPRSSSPRGQKPAGLVVEGWS